MLFTFSYFWKFLIFLISSWVFYGFFGYEISVVTLLAVIASTNLKSSNHRLSSEKDLKCIIKAIDTIRILI